MSMKFMSWTLKRPDSSTFNQYKQPAPGEPWYTKNYIPGTGKRTDSSGNVTQTFDPEKAPETSKDWSAGSSGFIRMIENNHEKIYAMGMHEFMICDDGTIANMGYGQVQYPNGYNYYDQTKKVLNADETAIELPVPTSLRYLMHKYPSIRWSVQILATKNSSGDRVNPLLDNKTNQDNCIRQTRKIVELYQAAGFPIVDIEVDCEKTTTRDGDAEKFRDFLVRVKNEACIPTGTNLRVNLFAMTGDFTPSYYGWHDYSTLASGNDMYGNQAIDEFQLMTYDFSWGGSAPGPSTPLWWLEQVLVHVNNVLPPEKTLIGNAGYGRRWPLSERRMGVTFDYKQLMQAQNGEYVHNDGSQTDGVFWFRNQDFIPFAGINDPNSDYQITYLHVYDSFNANHGEPDKDIVRPSDEDYVTTYSTKQKPKFTGIQKRLTSPTSVSGNASYGAIIDEYGNSTGESTWQPSKWQYDGYTYDAYISSKARWFWDAGKKDENGELIPDTGSCMKEKGPRGVNGSLTYNFSLPRSGSFKVIALVGFPFFGSDNFSITINGASHQIGSSVPDWYPYITNPEWHFWDCGTYSLGSSNTINVGLTNGAYIGGFIICEGFDENPTGGTMNYPTNLQKMKKRGQKKPNGTSEIIDAQFPSEMILTGELLRRPPRPAIIWEDMFGPHLNGDGFTSETDLTSVGPYYMRADPESYSSGTGEVPKKVGDKTYCISGTTAEGFSYGTWKVKDDGTEPAHAWTNTTGYSQLVLNKPMSGAAHIELDCKIDNNPRARYGIRGVTKKGDSESGWIFRLNFLTKVVEFYNFDNTSLNKTVNMSSTLANGQGNRYIMKVERINGELHFIVGDNTYFKIPDPNPSLPVAYGAYGADCYMKVYRLNVSTLERFEPMEKLYIYADGNKVGEYGEVKRTVPYDKYGYLNTSPGLLPGNLTEAVRAIPSEAESSSGQASQVEGRKGTIFETESSPEDWSLDYHNLPMVKVPSWLGKKDIKVEMKDPGIWMKTFYVGDAEGYSVAYNSDKIGFIRTSQMVLDYKCKGIALWTLGQEDPSVFSYLPKANE